MFSHVCDEREKNVYSNQSIQANHRFFEKKNENTEWELLKYIGFRMSYQD